MEEAEKLLRRIKAVTRKNRRGGEGPYSGPYGPPPVSYSPPPYGPPPGTYNPPPYGPPPAAYSPPPYSPPPATYSPPPYSPPPASYSPPPAAYSPRPESYGPPPPVYSPPPPSLGPREDSYPTTEELSQSPFSPSFEGPVTSPSEEKYELENQDLPLQTDQESLGDNFELGGDDPTTNNFENDTDFQENAAANDFGEAAEGPSFEQDRDVFGKESQFEVPTLGTQGSDGFDFGLDEERENQASNDLYGPSGEMAAAALPASEGKGFMDRLFGSSAPAQSTAAETKPESGFFGRLFGKSETPVPASSPVEQAPESPPPSPTPPPQPVTESATKPEAPPLAAAATAATVGGMWSWKWMIFAFLLVMIIWYIRPYVTMFSDLLKSANDLLESTVQPTEEKAKPAKPPPSKKVKAKVSQKKTTVPEPDESTSNVQGGAQGGFCLAGEWKGVRSCVKIPKGTECVSGQLFPTELKCTNPALRE